MKILENLKKDILKKFKIFEVLGEFKKFIKNLREA